MKEFYKKLNMNEVMEVLKSYDVLEAGLIQDYAIANQDLSFDEIKDTFYEDDEKLSINPIFTNYGYKKPSERFLSDYDCGITSFYIKDDELYMTFLIPGISEIFYVVNHDIRKIVSYDKEVIDFIVTQVK